MNRDALIRGAVIVAFVGLIEALCRTKLVPTNVLIAPSDMAIALFQLLVGGSVNGDIIRTVTSVSAAFLSAVVVGISAGAVIHKLPRLRRVLDPFFATYYAVPFFLFYPVLIAIFGLSTAPIIVMGFAFAVVGVIIATLSGLDRIPRVLYKLAQMNRMGPVRAALYLYLPAALPHLFSGIKLAVAYSFVGVLASEFILAPNGLGHAIAYAYNDWNNRTMYALVLLVILLVVAVNILLASVERRLARSGGRA